MMCHDVPSHRSASGRLTPSDGMYQPTPRQNRSAGQDTPRNWSCGVVACRVNAAVIELTETVAAEVIAPVAAATTGTISTAPHATPASHRHRAAARPFPLGFG
jgi:hypothetical protein